MTTVVPPAGGHGGDGAAVAAALGIDPTDVLDLSASMNPFAPDVRAIVSSHLDAIGRYPDPRKATVALAGTVGVDPERLLLTNGGAEAIALVASDMGRGWVDEPEFSLYARHLARVEPGAPRWRSDPHNPTGCLAMTHENADVWDEAFYPLATGRWTSGRAERGAIVVGSLTKLFSCPGLRIGFVLAPPGKRGVALVRRLAEAQPRWAVNGLVAAALGDLLAVAEPARWAADIAILRSELVAALAIRGLWARPSDANYVLVPDARGLRDLLAARAVVVRDCASFGLTDHVRIAVPDVANRARLMDAIDAIAMGSGPR